MSLSEIDVNGDLQCELDSRPVSIQAAGQNIVIRLPDLQTALAVVRLRLLPGSYRAAAHWLKQSLDAVHCNVKIYVDEQYVGAIGYRTGNPFWKLLGFPALTLKPLAILALRSRQ